MIFRKQKTELGETTRFRDRIISAFKRSKPLGEQVIAKESVNKPVQKKDEALCKGLEELPSKMIDRKVAINAMFYIARIFEISGAVMVGTFAFMTGIFALFSNLGFKDFFDFTMGCAVGIFASGALMDLGFRLSVKKALKEERESKVEK